MGIVKEMHLVEDLRNVKQVPSRDGYGEALLILGEKNPRVLVLDADLAKSTRTIWFRDKFPEKFIDMGIAEQDMLASAAGLAAVGFIPFCSTYGVFVAGRAWDQVRTSVCYGNFNVKIGGMHGGISVGPDGATHQSLEEIPLMRVLPGMTIFVPADAIEGRKAALFAAEHIGPTYIRYGREPVPVITTEETPFNPWKAEIYRTGDDVVIIAMGTLVYEGLLAAEELSKEGIEAMVINCHTIKPIDIKTIVDSAKKCGAIVTAEEHSIIGGLGGAVAEVICQHYPVPMRIIGIDDRFGESGPPEILMKEFGMSAENIIKKVKEVLKMKK
ncbi:MAG: transketolase family protein [bacterium]